MELDPLIVIATIVGFGSGIYARAWWIGLATALVLAGIIAMQLGTGKAWAGYGYLSFAFFVYVSLPAVVCAWIGWLVPRFLKELAEFGKNMRS